MLNKLLVCPTSCLHLERYTVSAFHAFQVGLVFHNPLQHWIGFSSFDKGKSKPETMVFPIEYGGRPWHFPLNQANSGQVRSRFSPSIKSLRSSFEIGCTALQCMGGSFVYADYLDTWTWSATLSMYSLCMWHTVHRTSSHYLDKCRTGTHMSTLLDRQPSIWWVTGFQTLGITSQRWSPPPPGLPVVQHNPGITNSWLRCSQL